MLCFDQRYTVVPLFKDHPWDQENVSYISLKKVINRQLPFGTKSSWLIIKSGLKIEGCKIGRIFYLIRARTLE